MREDEMGFAGHVHQVDENMFNHYCRDEGNNLEDITERSQIIVKMLDKFEPMCEGQMSGTHSAKHGIASKTAMKELIDSTRNFARPD